jgi:16S rRNA (uracil1498-N3)-methyltransferase
VAKHVHRFFVAGEHALGETAGLSDDERFHAEKVLRLRPGTRVEAADAAGAVYAAEFQGPGGLLLVELLTEAAPAAPAPIVWLALAGGRADTAVEKLTELGVAAIGLLQARNGKGDPRPDRWARIAQGAAAQSKRARLPRLLGPAPFAEVVFEGAWVLDHEADDARPFRPERGATLLVGPEAGFSDPERVLAREAGARLARLDGVGVLRSETAAIAAAAVALLAPTP